MSIPNWQQTEGSLTRSWKFADFSEAWAFASRVALVAEKANHHPEITVTWGKVTVTTSTHDAGNTVTEKDTNLAQSLNKLLAALVLSVSFSACIHAQPQQLPAAHVAKPDATCGDILYIDYGSGADAPAYYTDKQGNVIASCGGGLRQVKPGETRPVCPPDEWTCEIPPAQGASKHKLN